METSILKTIKIALGVPNDYSVFDEEITMYINMAFNTLTDLGVGPANGFMITDDSTKWSDYLADDNRINAIKTFIQLSAKIIFDPPAQSWVVTSIEKQIEQLAWRINVRQEATDYFHDVDGVDISLPVDKRPVLVDDVDV